MKLAPRCRRVRHHRRHTSDARRSAAGGGTAASWELGYTAYQQLWKLQGQFIEKLPLHHKGEVLSGLAQSAQRTGRSDEANAQLDRILTLHARHGVCEPSAAVEGRPLCAHQPAGLPDLPCTGNARLAAG